jgi:hypothetical protein
MGFHIRGKKRAEVSFYSFHPRDICFEEGKHKVWLGWLTLPVTSSLGCSRCMAGGSRASDEDGYSLSAWVHLPG